MMGAVSEGEERHDANGHRRTLGRDTGGSLSATGIEVFDPAMPQGHRTGLSQAFAEEDFIS